MIKAFTFLLILTCAGASRAAVTISDANFFIGVCDASAGAALNDDLFAAADDETNRLRIYSLSRGGAPVFELSMNRFLGVDPREPEADIEGAARIGDVIYWIGSHARSPKGKERTSRHRLFATRIVSTAPPKLEPIGRPYERLLNDLEQSAELEKFELDEAADLAPKEKHGLNIEGLCARPDGSLLIGFRNPVPKKLALLVPLLNPSEVVTGKPAHFGKPVRLDLGGRGIRDFVQRDGQYYIIAGASGSGSRFDLYAWDGAEAVRSLHRWTKDSLNPEAVLSLPGRAELLVLTDDSKSSGARDCKDLPPGSRRFRSVLVTPSVD